MPVLLGGGGIGLINGLLGGGGGMVAVPLLKRTARLPALNAHATAIAVILPASLISAIVYLIKGLVPMTVFVPVALGVTLGGLLGAKLLGKLPAIWVELIFASFMLAAGIRMLF